MDLITKLATTCLQVKRAAIETPGVSIVPDAITGMPEVTPESLRDTFEDSLQEEKALRNSARRYLRTANRRAMENEQSPGEAFVGRLSPFPWSSGEAAWRLPAIALSGYGGYLGGTGIAERLRTAEPAAVSAAFRAGESGESPISKELAKILKSIALPEAGGAFGPAVVKYPYSRISTVLEPEAGKGKKPGPAAAPLLEQLVALNPEASGAEVPESFVKELTGLQDTLKKTQTTLEANQILRNDLLGELQTKLGPQPAGPAPYGDAVGTTPTATPKPLSAQQLLEAAAGSPNPEVKHLLRRLNETDQAIMLDSAKFKQAQGAISRFQESNPAVLASMEARQKARDAAMREISQLRQMDPAQLEHMINRPANPADAARGEAIRRLADKLPAQTLSEMGPAGERLSAAVDRAATARPEDIADVLNPKGSRLRRLIDILTLNPNRQDRASLGNELASSLKGLPNSPLSQFSDLPEDILTAAYNWTGDPEKLWKPRSKIPGILGAAGGVAAGGALTGIPMAIRAARLNRLGGELAQKAREKSREAMQQADKEQFKRENILRALEGTDAAPKEEFEQKQLEKDKNWEEGLRQSARLAEMSGGDSRKLLEAFRQVGNTSKAAAALDTLREVLG